MGGLLPRLLWVPPFGRIYPSFIGGVAGDSGLRRGRGLPHRAFGRHYPLAKSQNRSLWSGRVYLSRQDGNRHLSSGRDTQLFGSPPPRLGSALCTSGRLSTAEATVHHWGPPSSKCGRPGPFALLRSQFPDRCGDHGSRSRNPGPPDQDTGSLGVLGLSPVRQDSERVPAAVSARLALHSQATPPPSTPSR